MKSMSLRMKLPVAVSGPANYYGLTPFANPANKIFRPSTGLHSTSAASFFGASTR